MHAHLISRQKRGVKRISRPSLAAEAVSLATAIDYSYWLRAVFMALLEGAVEYSCFNELKPSPLVIPFEFDSASGPPQGGKTDYCFAQSTTNLCVFDASTQAFCLSARDSGNALSIWTPCKDIRDQYQLFLADAPNDTIKLGMSVLADSANAFSAVHASNHRPNDRLTRLHL